MQNVVALPVRIDADSGAVNSSTVEAVLPSELLSGAGRRRSRQDIQPQQEAEETEETKRARLFGRTALDAEDYLRHAESVAGLIISIDASYWSFMDDGSVVVPDCSRYRGKVRMHILCYDLPLSISLHTFYTRSASLSRGHDLEISSNQWQPCHKLMTGSCIAMAGFET